MVMLNGTPVYAEANVRGDVSLVFTAAASTVQVNVHISQEAGATYVTVNSLAVYGPLP